MGAGTEKGLRGQGVTGARGFGGKRRTEVTTRVGSERRVVSGVVGRFKEGSSALKGELRALQRSRSPPSACFGEREREKQVACGRACSFTPCLPSSRMTAAWDTCPIMGRNASFQVRFSPPLHLPPPSTWPAQHMRSFRSNHQGGWATHLAPCDSCASALVPVHVMEKTASTTTLRGPILASVRDHCGGRGL